MKHNKKRNTAFLYECLIKEMTKAIVRKDEATKQTVVEILKNNFSKGSPLYNDLQQYKQLLETQNLSEEFATRFMTEVRKDWNELNRKEIFNCQTQLIKEMNETISSNVFGNFIPNYKNIATVGSWFQDNTSQAKMRLIIETKVKSLLTPSETKEKEMKHIDNLTYKTFVGKFNKTYKNSLKENQKNLLTNYITSFSDNGLGLKSFINEEITILKGQLNNKLLESKETLDEKRFENLSRVLNVLEEFGKKPLSEKMVKKLFYIQDLIGEI